MEKEIVKEGVKLAEEELRNEEKQKIKGVVKTILELLQEKEEKRKVLDDEIRILRKDIFDLKDGHLDRIKERQDLDPKSKEISVIIIKEKIIEKHIPIQPWYVPYIIEVKPQYVPYYPTYYGSAGNGSTLTISNDCIGTLTNANTATLMCNTTTGSAVSFTTNNSNTHMFVGGTYMLENKTIKHI